VAHLIDEEFNVRYHEGHVWKILVALGWSPQRPEGRARERNEEQILNWKKNVWPALKKSAPRRAHPRLHRRAVYWPPIHSGKRIDKIRILDSFCLV
jgi:Winged helix-turn helix